jgi:hypothetical protein
MIRCALLLLLLPGPPLARAVEHACAADAREKARALLLFHTEADRNVYIDEEVRVLPSLANPAAPKQRFDVLETWGYLYKAKYRLRLIYAQVPGSCVLMGQEILEHARL